MIERTTYLERLSVSTARSPITALLGPRQSGKTTLANQFAQGKAATVFDLESDQDVRALANPELTLGELTGLVVLDEIQRMPSLFRTLRVLVDRPQSDTQFLILGSASPDLVRGASESLAGRIEFVDIAGFNMQEIGSADLLSLMLRGGFPRAYLASSDADSFAWRQGFIRTFLERDMPEIGIRIPPIAMRRFWTMLAHWHGRTWNASELGRSLGASDKTLRSYLDMLTGTFMIRQLQPWHTNVNKRQVKAPKVYFRDSGLLHALLGIETQQTLMGHGIVGLSWEGFLIEQILSLLNPPSAWFWAAHAGGEIDLIIDQKGKRIGFEMKFSEAPKLGKALYGAVDILALDHLYVVCPTRRAYPVNEHISVLPAASIPDLANSKEPCP
ncbi:MAG: ATP-binding protein [Gammaproteobacteria bacterium]|nr:ATP-binding protein [Gammaproteobacteria bacterium]